MNGATPLATAQRDLAVVARSMTPVLAVLAEFRRPISIGEVAQKSGLEAHDVRHALIALEHAGLADTTHFQVTENGIRATKE